MSQRSGQKRNTLEPVPAGLRTIERKSSAAIEPDRRPYTWEQVLGIPEEYPGQDDHSQLPSRSWPEVEPEEFESAYLWFLS